MRREFPLLPFSEEFGGFWLIWSSSLLRHHSMICQIAIMAPGGPTPSPAPRAMLLSMVLLSPLQTVLPTSFPLPGAVWSVTTLIGIATGRLSTEKCSHLWSQRPRGRSRGVCWYLATYCFIKVFGCSSPFYEYECATTAGIVTTLSSACSLVLQNVATSAAVATQKVTSYLRLQLPTLEPLGRTPLTLAYRERGERGNGVGNSKTGATMIGKDPIAKLNLCQNLSIAMVKYRKNLLWKFDRVVSCFRLLKQSKSRMESRNTCLPGSPRLC